MKITLHIITTLSVFFLICSCSQNSDTNTTEQSAAIPYVVDKDFASNPFPFPVSVQSIREHFGPFQITAQPTPNQHTPSVIDTVLSLSKHAAQFRFYCTGTKELFQSATITSDQITFARDLTIGMTKHRVGERFHRAIVADSIRIGDPERNNVWTLFFHDDSLVRISFLGYID